MVGSSRVRPERPGYFEGWYYKHQAGGKTLAVIPGRSEDEAFIQVLTADSSYYAAFPLDSYSRDGHAVTIEGNSFSTGGIRLDIDRPDLRLTGEVAYSNLTPIHGDIMGPFRFFPMECRHGILSMRHGVSGDVVLNGETLGFDGGRGYIELDNGVSFPATYAWVHSNAFSADCSITAAVARIPFYGLTFMGVICVVVLNGREYRLATYRGVKVVACKPGRIELRQGKYRLEVTVDSQGGHSLAAPRLGKMDHEIVEDISCPATFRFSRGDEVLFEETSEQTSYEFF